MAKILVLQHSPYEPLGIIIHTLRRMKLRVRYVNFAREPLRQVDISNYHGIVVLGGAMHPNQMDLYPHLAHEIELLQGAIAKSVPILGICLGSQLLNLALGGRCYALDKPELGWVKVKKCGTHDFFELFEQPMHVFQWHQFANETAPGVDVVLENSECVQAFSYQQSCIGLQFHLEVDVNLIKRWLGYPDYLEHLHRHLPIEEIETMRSDAKLHLPNSIKVAEQFFENFCRLFDKKMYALSSQRSGGKLY